MARRKEYKRFDRKKFFINAYRILKPGGMLSVYYCKLKPEWDWHLPSERLLATNVGFESIGNFTGGMILLKPKVQRRGNWQKFTLKGTKGGKKYD